MGLFGFKGPKELLSSAIASNLGTFFEVDQKKIESNLLADTKIVLHDAKLKDQIKVLQTFGDLETGRSSVVHVTGTVQEVVFSWKWSVPGASPDSSWVQDATLTIRGLDFKANLSWWDNKTVQEKIPSTEASAASNPNKPQSQKHDEGALHSYIKQQVAMIIDSLKLQVEDYKFIVELETATIGGTNDRTAMNSIAIGGKAVDVISMGRHRQHDTEGSVTTVDMGNDETVSVAAGKNNIEIIHDDGSSSKNKEEESSSASPLPLEQMFVLESFSVILHSSDDNVEPKPILDTFSYKAKAVRLEGERFLTGMGTGLQVKGDPPSKEGKLNFYAGESQIQAMKDLSGFVLAPALEKAEEKVEKKKEEEEHGIEMSLSKYENDDSIVSFFEFPLNEVSLHLDSSNLLLSSFVLKYQADGALAEITADKLAADSNASGNKDDQMHFCARGIRANLRPSMILELDTVESLRVPDVIQLTKPTKNTSFHYNEGMLKMKFDSIHAQQLEKRNDNDDVNESGENKVEEVPKANWKAALPFPVNICANDIHLANAYNIKEVSNFIGLELDVAPGIDVAITLQRAHNDLYDIENIAVTALIPVDKDDVVEKLHVAAAQTTLTAGRSANEWENRLESRPKKKKSEAVNFQLPFARIETLNLNISFRGIVSTKDNKLVTRPFMGTETTTQQDLVRHYTGHIMGKVPGFITHAEILGVNVVDTGASTYGSWMLSATAFGPLGGLAGIAGVDAVKGTIAAGKRSRKVENTTEDDKFHATDIFRGVVHAAKEATEVGAAKRGKDSGRGNLIDWAVGSTENTQTYAKQNKSRLGAAGAGGAGFLAGTLLLGPAAPIALPFAAGFLASRATGKALDRAEEREKSKGEIVSAAEDSKQ